jgi:cell division protein FtsW
MFVCLASVLIGFGLLMVHSASATSWPSELEQVHLLRHLLFLGIGTCGLCVCASLPARFWYHASPALFSATIVLLILVLVPSIGTRVNGGQRWLRYGSWSVQPSEIAKVTLILFLCRLIQNRRESLSRWISGTIPFLVPVLVVVLLVFRQPDLGTAAFLLVAGAITLFVAGWPIRNFVLGLGVAGPASVFFLALKPYQLRRITGFMAMWSDGDQAPYQLKQSLLSLGVGGLNGIGLGRGWQKLSFLPEANTDFVFAVVGEELGLLGTLSLLLLWIGMYFSGLRLLSRLPQSCFCRVAGIALLTQLAVQAALHVAVVTALIPPKGIAHPLLSYGGSNLVMSMVALGIVLSLSRADPERDALIL